ncbi:MAG: ABC transporter permease subunit [Gemmataceae bacterium]|nr:ABC transporter permease subunit [Gemmataceae bacterium]
MATVLRKLLLVCCGLAALAAPLVWGADWPAAATIALALAVVWLLELRRKHLGLLGPHFSYDTIRLARKGRTILVRILYLLVLLLTLWWSYQSEIERSQSWQLQAKQHANPFRHVRDQNTQPQYHLVANDQARVAERFVFTILLVQNLAILFLAPIYFGSALAEERERRTLELLQTTPLYSREIFFSKFWSRVLHLGGVVLASLPVLSLTQLFGGVDIEVVLANYLHSYLLLIAAGSLCLAISATASTATMAVLWSYGVMLTLYFSCVGFLCITPTTGGRMFSNMMVLTRDEFQRIWWTVAGSAILTGLIASVSWLLGILRLAGGLVVPAGPRHARRDETDPTAAAEAAPSAPEPAAPRRWYEPPSNMEDALSWKELHFGGKTTAENIVFILSILFSALVLIFFSQLHQERPSFYLVDSAVLGICCVSVALSASAGIARERERATLDNLLTLPVQRWEILWAKWKASLFNSWAWVGLHLGLGLTALLTTRLHSCCSAFLVFAPLAHLLFLASLGLYFSVMSKSAFSARLKLIGVVFVLSTGSFLYNLVVPEGNFDGVRLVLYGINPIVAWNLPFFPDSFMLREPVSGLLALVFGHLLYFVFASWFWILAMLRFQKLQ